MHYDLLARFINQSHNWSRVKRGREASEYAAELFKELFQVDSGFFVYKKRLPSEASEHLMIFSPWGYFEEGAFEFLKAFLDTNYPTLESLSQVPSGQWLDVKDASFEINRNIQQFGIWNMYSGEEIIGGIILARSQPKDYGDQDVISICANQVALIIDMVLAWRMADELSRYDSLTGVLNRRGILREFERAKSNAESNGSMLMIGVVDIDSFKQINDCNGHPAGDKILIEVAKTLRMNIRSNDLVARLGGDEFVLIMQTESQNCLSIRQRIEELFPPSGGYTISVGFALWNIDGQDWDSCYKVADQRLLNRKSEKKLHVHKK